jgi:hypothetical protein
MPDTKTARIQLDARGFPIVRINDGAQQSLADTKENLAVAVSETRGTFSALALLVEANPFGRMFGNVYLRIAKPGIPTRLFSDEAEAATWLNGHRS